jgi:hypothetical protein
MRPGRCALGAVALAGVALAGPAFAAGAEGNEAGFALVLGVNRGIDPDSAPLRYADDDAVRFQTLFRTVGMTTYTLARLDDNTRRLHPGVAGEVAAPRLAELRKVVDRLRADVARARAAGKKTVFYLAYAGHGKADGGNGYLMLEDARLRGPDLLGEIIDPVNAEATHVVADACYSFSAIIGRGPGGTRRPLERFSQLGIAQRPDIGVLLSTSSARESHEWSAFQAGVFSHEVRSGLYGAADADGNGLVSYLEIASFVDRANVSVPNELFRPEVFARPPPGGGVTLLDLRPALGARIEVDSPRPGHRYLEDPAGVRWADFHNAGTLRLLRPVAGRLYLRRAAGDREQVVPEGSGVVRTSQLPEQDSHVAARGAAHDLFRALFELPFSPEAISSYAARDWNRGTDLTAVREGPLPPARVAALAIGAGGLAAAAAGAVVLMTAHTLRGDVQPESSQREIEATNARIAQRNRWGAAFVAAGGAAVLTSATLWFLKGTPASHVEVAATPAGWTAGLRGSF